jgi:hypothetical protein
MKIGDKIYCHNSEGINVITVGKHYTIKDIRNNDKELYFIVKDDIDRDIGFYVNTVDHTLCYKLYFYTLKELRGKKIVKLNKLK